MSMAFITWSEIKYTVKDPVANEQQFDLLLEMYLLVTYQPGLILLQTTYPDEKEKRKSSVVIEYPTGGVDGYG